jgi:hypothetical protein
MNRRETLIKLMAASAGLVALPSWANGWSKNEISASSLFSSNEEATLASVADTIIPAGNSIGALSVGVDKFLQKLFDECYEKEVQDNIKTQLRGLNSSAQNLYGKAFADCSSSQREQLLLKLADSQDGHEKDFFSLIKAETIRGFNTSEEVMLKYLNYKVAPGHYYGCVDAKA